MARKKNKKRSRIAEILTLIGGILTLVGSAIMLFLLIFVFSFLPLYNELVVDLSLEVAGLFIFAIFSVLLIVGVLKIYASRLMRSSETLMKGGIFAIVLAVVTSDLFSLVGGIIALVQAES